MKTIEERAEEAQTQMIATSPYVLFREGYIKGATEQRKIDIDRAYSWLMRILDDNRSFVVWRDFRKFMMEE